MRTLVILLSIAAATLCAPMAQAQRPELNTQADVDQRVMSALQADKAEGKLAELALSLGLRGSFTFDLTVGDKGQALVVFPVESTIDGIDARNRLKDQLKAMRFPFKLPKGKRFTTRQTLQFP